MSTVQPHKHNECRFPLSQHMKVQGGSHSTSRPLGFSRSYYTNGRFFFAKGDINIHGLLGLHPQHRAAAPFAIANVESEQGGELCNAVIAL